MPCAEDLHAVRGRTHRSAGTSERHVPESLPFPRVRGSAWFGAAFLLWGTVAKFIGEFAGPAALVITGTGLVVQLDYLGLLPLRIFKDYESPTAQFIPTHVECHPK